MDPNVNRINTMTSRATFFAYENEVWLKNGEGSFLPFYDIGGCLEILFG